MKTLNQYSEAHEENPVQVLSLSHLPSIITASPTCPLSWITASELHLEGLGGPAEMALMKHWMDWEVQTGKKLVQKHGGTIPLTKKMQEFHFEPKPVFFLDCATPIC